MDAKKTAVLLLNMGGPETAAGIRPFLFRLFSDPAIIGAPAPVRIPLAALLSTLRASRVRPRYAAIGGGSPIRHLTAEQGGALAARLGERGLNAACFTAFRYSPPFTAEAVEAALSWGAERMVALSLYPQYCSATTGTSLAQLERVLARRRFPRERLTLIRSFPDHPGYLAALAETVEERLLSLPAGERSRAVVLFSAHGVPQALVDGGDPYRDELERTVRGVMARLGGQPHRLAFQSKLGPVKWLSPSLGESLRELAGQGAPPVVVVPVSFVSDHIETLHELDIEYAELARGLGFSRYLRAPALNARPAFISALADLVVGA